MTTLDDFTVYAEKLRGQTLEIPDLSAIYARWPTAVSPHYEELVQLAEQEYLELFSADPKTLAKAGRAALPLFASTWYPHAPVKKLMTIIEFSLWIFFFDDAFDGEDASLESGGGGDGALRLRNLFLAFVEHHLGLGPDGAAAPETPSYTYMHIFLRIKDEFKHEMTVGQRKRFFGELKRYMDCCVLERERLNQRTLPNVQDYWEQRLGTCAGFTYCALVEYATPTALPETVFETDEVWKLWREVCFSIGCVNDILSLHLEFSYAPSSSIPVVMKATGADLPTAVASLVQDLKTSAEMFDATSEQFMERLGGSELTRVAGESYLDMLKALMTGHCTWELNADRYGVKKYIQVDGSIVIPLAGDRKNR